MTNPARHVLVIDAGKTHVKACVVDVGGRITARRQRDTPVAARGDYPYIDVDTLGAWLIEALTELAHEFDIRTIVPVAHGSCAAVMAGDERVLPVMDYEWTGVNEIDAEYDVLRPPFSETGSPALAAGLNLGRQLYWQQRYRKPAFDRADAILCYPQYWAWFLSGARIGEVTSLGSHSDLWNPTAQRPSSLVERAGWRSLFPARQPAWATAGPLRPELARRTGLSPACTVKTGIHDSNASYLRHRASHDPPFTVVSTGTWIILMAAGGDPAVLDEQREMLANVDAYAAPVPSARFMGGREYEAIAGEAGGDIELVAADLDAIVADGVMALPGFTDAGGPFGRRRGGYLGTPPETARGRAALATLYCALVCDYALSLLAVDHGPLIVEGSFTRNAMFAPLLAQLRDQPVQVSADDTGTVSGAALLAHDDGPPGQPAATRSVAPSAILALDHYRRRWLALGANRSQGGCVS